jgi:ABC-type sulfate transport system permease component
MLVPTLLTGFALALARAVGEYGSVIFIAGNIPMRSEIAPLLIVQKLENSTTPAAAHWARSCWCLARSRCAGHHTLQRWSRRWAEQPHERAARPPSVARRLGAASIIHRLSFLCALPPAAAGGPCSSKRSAGLHAYFESHRQPEALAAIRLTLLVAAITVPLNLVFGVAAAWAMTRFEFRGKALLGALHRPCPCRSHR